MLLPQAANLLTDITFGGTGDVFPLVNFNPSTIVFTLVNTGIVTLGYFFLLHKKVSVVLSKRKELVNADIEAAKAAKERAEKAEKDYISKISESKEEARKIIEDAKKTAEKKSVQIIDEAKSEAKAIAQKGSLDAEKERKAALNSLKNQIGELVIGAAGAVSGREITAANNIDIIQDFLAQAESL